MPRPRAVRTNVPSAATCCGLATTSARRTAAAHPLDMGSDRLNTVGDLGDQDNVGTPGNSRGERDVSGIAAHDLEDHDAVMAGRRRLQPVERLCCHHHRGAVADRALGGADIIVDCLRYSDEIDPTLLGETAQDGKAAVAADA